MVFGAPAAPGRLIDYKTRTIKDSAVDGPILTAVTRIHPYSAPPAAAGDAASSSVAPSFKTGGSRHQLNNPSLS